ncbi:MAG: metal-dependent hydrolase [Candidatus Thorarchaeota archaeon]
MRGESHLIASFMISLPTIMALYTMAPDTMTEVMAYVLGGVLLGCLLPDVDASDAKVMHGYWRPIGLFGKYVFYKPMTWILRTRSDAYREQHRGYLHSFIGCFLATIFFAFPIAIIFLHSTYVMLLPLETTIWVWFVWIGLPFGFLMHLVEDSFTKSGVRWIFPGGRTYSSQTRTGKKSEYNLLSAFIVTFGILTAIVYMATPSFIVLFGAILGSLVLLGVLYAVNPIISRLSNETGAK